MNQEDQDGLSPQELEAQEASNLPDREAMSLLDVNANLDLALDVAAPIDAAVAANANVAAPIDASVSANVLSPDGTSVAQSPQNVTIAQDLDGEATAIANQDSTIGQGETADAEPAPAAEAPPAEAPATDAPAVEAPDVELPDVETPIAGTSGQEA